MGSCKRHWPSGPPARPPGFDALFEVGGLATGEDGPIELVGLPAQPAEEGVDLRSNHLHLTGQEYVKLRSGASPAAIQRVRPLSSSPRGSTFH